MADRVWPVLWRAAGIHTWLYRVSGGRIGHSIPGVGGKMALLDHVGAKSGRLRTTPLLYFADGANVVVIASKGGFPRHPAWYHNLIANPDTTVQIGGERRAVHARAATAEEREHLWPVAELLWAGYADYRAHSKGRAIPLVILESRAD